MDYNEIKEYYENHKEELCGHGVKRKEHAEFRKHARLAHPFLNELKGRVEFSVVLYCLEHGITELPKCEWCGDKVRTSKAKKGGGFPRTCSRKCNGALVVEEQRESNMEKFGVEYHTQRESVKEKAEETFLANWGATHFMKTEEGKDHQVNAVMAIHGVRNVFELDSVKEKIVEGMRRNHGVDHPMYCDEIKSKVRQTNLEKWGVEYATQSEDVQKKTRDTCIERYGSSHFFASDEGKLKIKEIFRRKYGRDYPKQVHISEESLRLLEDPIWLEETYNRVGGVELGAMLGVDSSTVYERLKKFNIPVKQNHSFAETELREFVENIVGDVEVLASDRDILEGKEIDILIPSLGIGIEFNGLYWHSTAVIENTSYHLEKTELAKTKGIRLIHIWEDEWKNRKEQVKRMLASILGVSSEEKIFARRCHLISDIDREVLKEFYNTNHIQGNGHQSVSVGLKHEGELVAAMSFRKRNDSEYELTRYATSKRVVGGFSRLLKNAEGILSEMGVSKIVSFADKRYSVGGLYINNGWNHVGDIRPDYTYLVGEVRVRKQNYRRKYLPEKLEVFDPELSESVNMFNNKLYQVFDCGLMKFEKEIRRV